MHFNVLKNSNLSRCSLIPLVWQSSVPGVGLTPTEAPSKEYLGKALAVAKSSTASIGKFTDALPKEKPAKNMGKKRKVKCLMMVKLMPYV